MRKTASCWQKTGQGITINVSTTFRLDKRNAIFKNVTEVKILKQHALGLWAWQENATIRIKFFSARVDGWCFGIQFHHTASEITERE